MWLLPGLKREIVLFGSDLTGRARKGTFAHLLGNWLGRLKERGDAVCIPVKDVPLCANSASGDVAVAAESIEPSRFSTKTRLTVPVTHLATYDECLRRGFLTYDVGLAEREGASLSEAALERRLRDPPLDPLNQGQLVHGILEGLERLVDHGSTAAFVDAELRALGYDPHDPIVRIPRRDALAFLASDLGKLLSDITPAKRYQELPFHLEVPGPESTLVLLGQIDLVAWVDGQPVVVDFKHAAYSPQSERHYAWQLDAYATAVAQGEATVDTRLVYIKGDQREIRRAVGAGERRAFLQRAAALGEQLAGAIGVPRTEDGGYLSWPGRSRNICEEIGCGFISRCHGTDRKGHGAQTSKATPEGSRERDPSQLDLPW